MRRLTAKDLCLAAGVLFLVAGLTTGLVFIALPGIPVKTVRTDKATARVSFTLRNLINPHSDGRSLLIVGGRTYYDLRGEPPFYVDVPGGGSRVLFVTHKLTFPYSATLHVLDLESNIDTTVDITDTGFGWNLGSARASGEDFTDFIKSAEGERLVIATRSMGRQHEVIVDLRSKTIRDEGAIGHGPAGVGTNSDVDSATSPASLETPTAREGRRGQSMRSWYFARLLARGSLGEYRPVVKGP